MRVAIPLFDRLTALDAVGPYEVLSRLPGVEIAFVASDPGPKRTDAGLALLAETPLSQIGTPDIIVVPGGVGVREAMRDASLLDWIRRGHVASAWTTSVCTGALVLGAGDMAPAAQGDVEIMARLLPAAGHRVTRLHHGGGEGVVEDQPLGTQHLGRYVVRAAEDAARAAS